MYSSVVSWQQVLCFEQNICSLSIAGCWLYWRRKGSPITCYWHAPGTDDCISVVTAPVATLLCSKDWIWEPLAASYKVLCATCSTACVPKIQITCELSLTVITVCTRSSLWCLVLQASSITNVVVKVLLGQYFWPPADENSRFTINVALSQSGIDYQVRPEQCLSCS